MNVHHAWTFLSCSAEFPRAGVGLKPEHYRTILETSPEIGFFEVHAENYMGAGGPPHRYLSAIRERYPLSIHGVGLSIGADRPLARDHLRRLKGLVDRYQPALVSEHLAWSTHDAGFLNDLLPVPYTMEALARVVNHIDEVQEVLGRQMLLENPSTYLAFAESILPETDFIAEIVKRSGCALLLDVNNVIVASANQGWDPIAYLDGYPLDHVRQIHLAGHLRETDEYGRTMLIDTHDRQVDRNVWSLYRHTIHRIGPAPTLIEWDAKVPEWPALMAEATQAERIMLETNTGRLEQQRLDRKPCQPSRVDDPEGCLLVRAGSLSQRQAAFANVLLDPARAIPQGLVGPDGKSSVRRFNVYRNNVVAGLTSTLKDAFPAVARIVGDEFFAAMARTYVTTHPPTSPIMLDYGGGFATFIGAFEPAIRNLPYLRDVARLERAWLEAYHSAEAQPLSAEALAGLNAEDLMNLRITLHPSLGIVCSEFPVLTLWQTNIAGGVPTWVDLNAGGQDVLVIRPGADVELRALPPGGGAFIEVLRGGLCALESMECALAVDDRFDLAVNLAILVDAGALIMLDFASGRSIQ
ncbi:DUF692 family protein [Burkholderia cenocepacia]|nr:DUF692 family protein [Burkholderia cenocepacia]RQU63187.1 DUF692 family protein [Burkholderia cenocepacia]